MFGLDAERNSRRLGCGMTRLLARRSWTMDHRGRQMGEERVV